ncbi:MAG: nucleotidyltransferase family protein [Clostridia bacterium]|nr:nucleotidyltransferase family protein [Clostridia bacterium]
MVTVAIISEYNPFHLGHEYQIKKIREKFGKDTAIVSIMSGNFTQRGEIAIMPKGERAKCAVLGGVNLVLELPFPFSSSSAELFAKSGVAIANALGVVDYLSFGSECGEIDLLYKAAEIYLSSDFKREFEKLSGDKSLGFPARLELAYKAVAGSSEISFTPNNILSIEYIKALIESESTIKPHTVKRCGAAYNDVDFVEGSYQSASAIRNALIVSDEGALNFVTAECRKIIEDAKINGELPCDISKLSSAFISKLRLNSSVQREDYHDAHDGLYNRLYNLSFEANDITSLLKLSETKSYTNARIRRALLNIFFGVTSSDVKMLPRFTQVLGMDSVGMKILKRVKETEFRILTKPSAYDNFDDDTMKQKLVSDKADSIFELTKPIPKHGRSALTFTPFIKK